MAGDSTLLKLIDMKSIHVVTADRHMVSLVPGTMGRMQPMSESQREYIVFHVEQYKLIMWLRCGFPHFRKSTTKAGSIIHVKFY